MRISVTKTNSVNEGNPQFFIWIPLICLIVSGLSQTFMIKFSNIRRNPFPFSHLLLYIIWFNSRFTWTATNNLFSLGFMFPSSRDPIPSSYGFKMFDLVVFVASCESIASCFSEVNSFPSQNRHLPLLPKAFFLFQIFKPVLLFSFPKFWVPLAEADCIISMKLRFLCPNGFIPLWIPWFSLGT